MPTLDLSLEPRPEGGWLVLTQAELRVQTHIEPITNLLFKKLLQHMALEHRSGQQALTRGNYVQVLDLIN